MSSQRVLGPHCVFCSYKAFLQSPLQHGLIARAKLCSKPATFNKSLRKYHTAEPRFRSQGSSGAASRRIDSSRYRRQVNERLDAAQTSRERMRVSTFQDIVRKRLDILSSKLDDPSTCKSLGLDQDSLQTAFDTFSHSILSKLVKRPSSREESLHVTATLRQAFSERKEEGLDSELRLAFYRQVINSTFSESDLANQKRLADLRYPEEWHPATRAVQRKIHLHVGPTNSGKTFQALKRLEEVESGVYAGPLRLLAHEVYTRLTAKGKICNLLTGDEQRLSEEGEAFMSSCTVEMIPTSRDLDVAVIDEIQMLGDVDRGWAWTEAFLGVRAKEVHVCGEERAVPLVQALAISAGDEIEIHRYKRLSPLECMDSSLHSDLKTLRKGDCVVVFSRIGLHFMKREIEEKTRKRCAIVYGSLPPQIRSQQAKLFNDPNNDYDYLVASDAIGMGLNLNIKRIIFESTQKFTGVAQKTLAVSEIKQIAGRAGRYSTATDDIKGSDHSLGDAAKFASMAQVMSTPSRNSNLGLVTTLDQIDLPVVQHAMSTDAAPISTAGLFAPDSVRLRFAAYFRPETPFSYVLLRLHELAQMNPRFHLCSLRDQILIADLVQPIKGLSILDKISLCAAPYNSRDSTVLRALATCIGEQREADPLRMPEFDIDLLDVNVKVDKQYLLQLENLHRGLVLYLWLSYRFSGVFRSRSLAFHIKELVEERIDQVLGQVRFDRLVRKAKARSPEMLGWLETVKKDFVNKEKNFSEGQGKEVDVGGTAVTATESPDIDSNRIRYVDRETPIIQAESAVA
ncbi:MAG: RNA helicase [Sclerophora amabilis]|nr:MAG: RNA helicase [Sclerophora amabilis]